MTTTHSVRPVTEQERQQAIGALVLAHGRDPLMRWAFPSPQQYLEHFPAFARLLGGPAFEGGTAYCAGDFAATAFWLPAGAQPDGPGLVGLLQRAVPARQREAALAIREGADECRPTGDYWYLALMGVDPTRRGQGFGSTLLQRGLERCDAAGVPAYLECSDERSIPFYQRHGFQVVGAVQVADAPTVWPMHREAR